MFVLFRYQVALNIQPKNPLLIERGSPLVATFNESLLPGKTYQVEVKTISGSVPSWPANGTVTTRPLPVQNLRQVVDENTGEVRFEWDPHPESHQDSYRVGTFTICKNCASLTFNPIGAGGAESARTIFKRPFLHEKRVLEVPNFVTFPNSL